MDKRTVILFVSTSAKFVICTIVGLHGTHVEGKMRTLNILVSTSVPFRPTIVQVPKLAQNWHETDSAGKKVRTQDIVKRQEKDNTVKKVSGFPVPSRDVTYQSLTKI